MLPILFAFLIVAHRGASADAPENTIPAFELAWEQGADAIEGDFHLTKDGHIVCIHDSDTEKVADKTLVVAQSTLAELQELDVGQWKDPKFAGTRIPTLEEVIGTVPKNKKIYVEVKVGPEMVKPLKQELSESSLNDDQIVVISFEQDFVTAWKEACPDSKTMLLISYDKKKRNLSPSAEETLAILERTGADGLSTNTHPKVDSEFMKQIQDSGYEHHAWTINDVKTARRFADYGTLSITTDRPGALRRELSP
jgi:glycerophosphoryl diester phosphodiesterase